MTINSTVRLQVRVSEKSFQGRCILRDIAFSVAAGEIVAILGASGCGKSTLLRVIAGLDRDLDGIVNINATHGEQAIVGMVYQEPRLLPWLTVEQNIAFSLAESKNHLGNSSIEALLQEVMLENARHYWPKQLSGGMAQRVAIARALVREPDVLLLDEPFSALDVLTRRNLHTLTRRITAAHNTATVIVTHDPAEAVNLADRILVLAPNEAGIAAITHEVAINAQTTRARAMRLLQISLPHSKPSPRKTPHDHNQHSFKRKTCRTIEHRTSATESAIPRKSCRRAMGTQIDRNRSPAITRLRC